MAKSPIKAYKNLDFLNSPDARPVRVLCELMEPKTKLRRYHIENTIVFFGSARAKPFEIAERDFLFIEKQYKNAVKPGLKIKEAYENAQAQLYMAQYYEKARELSYKLTKFINQNSKSKSKLTLCTGGGAGIMEAVNLGANEAGGKSIGFNISLPVKQNINKYVSDDLSFEFHYFFIRKFWFAYLAKALIIFPGGLGTLDEMMEMLTLLQTGVIKKKMPVIIFGSEYWNKIINFDELIKFKTVDADELKLLNFFDDVDEVFDFLKNNLKRYL
ncbi:MAG: TIGR00730 family Rossman fold protein [Candidatus Firestonebacteria bacterium]|nr:TIGR00730 family Rossman fold protein [Candidatus Firestonebacteria bacterium]